MRTPPSYPTSQDALAPDEPRHIGDLIAKPGDLSSAPGGNRNKKKPQGPKPLGVRSAGPRYLGSSFAPTTLILQPTCTFTTSPLIGTINLPDRIQPTEPVENPWARRTAPARRPCPNPLDHHY